MCWMSGLVLKLSMLARITAACGLAQNYTQLLLARVVVGLGESGCQPPSLSLIADYAPKEKRASSMGTYSLGISVGGLVALALGGVLADQFGWRTAFFLAGVPGILLAVVAGLTLKDPRSQGVAADRPPARSVRECFAELRTNSVFWWVCLASAAKALVSYGQVAFLGSFFLRVHKEGLAEVAGKIGAAKDAKARFAAVEAKASEAERLFRPGRAEVRRGLDAVCTRAPQDEAADLRASLASSAAQGQMEMGVIDARPEAAEEGARLTPVRLRFEATGSYEAAVLLLDMLGRRRPEIFVDAVDLTAKTSNVTLTFSGRVFCSA